MLIMLLTCFTASAQEAHVPQWRSIALETHEGGNNALYIKGSAITFEQDQGKLFYGLETKKDYDSVNEVNFLSYGLLVGYQPDWLLAVEPRASISVGIVRGDTKGSILSAKLEGDYKIARSFYLTFGVKLESIQGSEKQSGSYQSSFLGIRILAY